MKRDILSSLQSWKTDPRRKPLIIQGARNVGKTYLVESFGKSEFKHFFSINFEQQPRFKSCFEIPEPEEIITRIELTAKISLSQNETLLFLDEIQDCPKASASLRHFYEKKPSLGVIAAGSFLEFFGQTEKSSVPAERILMYTLFPLSFGEFLTACGEERLREYLKNCSISDSIPESLVIKCTSLLRIYLFTGGMPCVVSDWIERVSFVKTPVLHESLIQTYRQDFGKYEKKKICEILESALMKIPKHIGKIFSYSAIEHISHVRDVKRALVYLEKSRIILRIYSVSGAKIPFFSDADNKKFKLLFLDVGLLLYILDLSSEMYLAKDLLEVYDGTIARQFVGQQLISNKKAFEVSELFYWKRKAQGSEAQVDFVYQYGKKIIPIMVKPGATGSLKSLHLFMKENQSRLGIRLSMRPLSLSKKVLSIPFYALEAMPRLIGQALEGQSTI